MTQEVRVPADIGKNGHCEGCGKWSTELKHVISLGYDNWICPDCERRIRERIRRRGMIAGEHTEPAE